MKRVLRVAAASQTLLLVSWAATRLVLLLVVMGVVPYDFVPVTSDVSGIYEPWYEVLRTGRFPQGDDQWQYPPGAAAVLFLPGLVAAASAFTYAQAFFVLMVAADATVMFLLLRSCQGRSPLGGWVWVVGVPLIGPLLLARYDLAVTALAVAGLVTARPRLSGTLIGLAAAVKIWPAVLLIGTPPGRRTRDTVGAALIAATFVTICYVVAMPGALSFITAQRDRGLEFESVGASIFLIARHHGWSGVLTFRYGSIEFVGPWVDTVSTVSMLLTVAALAWLAVWRRRRRVWNPATPCDAALTGTLLFVVTSRVLSPQYMVWLVGLAAVCAAIRGSSQRPVVLLVLAAAALTQLEFPVLHHEIIDEEGHWEWVLLTRNALLAAATVLSCLRLWRFTRESAKNPGEDLDQEQRGTDRPAGSAG